jgi:hypothetical protein
VRRTGSSRCGDSPLRPAAAGNTALACSISLTTLSSTRTISRIGTTTVVCVRDVNLGNGQIVTLNGGVSDEFVFVVKGKFTVNGGKIKVAGGAAAENVRYNVAGTGSQVTLSGGSGGAACCKSEVDGTVVAAARDIILNPGLIHGEVCGGRNISITNGSSVQDTLAAP